MTPAIQSLLVLLGVIIVMIADVLPITVVALVGALVCGFLGLIPLSSIFATLGSTTTILIVGMGVIGDAFFRTGLGTKVSSYILARLGKTEHGVYLAMMLLACLLSAVTSTTAVVLMLLPLAKSLCRELDISVGRILYPLTAATSFGHALLLVGAPSNIAGNAALEAAGLTPMGFFDVTWVGVPLTILSFAWMLTIGKRTLPANTGYEAAMDEGPAMAVTEGDPRKIRLAAIILIVTLVVMMLQLEWIPLYAIAIIGALLLIVTKCVPERSAWQGAGMDTLLLITGLMAISSAVTQSGGGQLIAQWVIKILSGSTNPYIITFVIGGICTLLTAVMSNTACVAVMAPVAISIAQAIGVSPLPMIVIVVIACNAASITPIGDVGFSLIVQPANYKLKDFLWMGLPLSLINLLVAMIMIPLVWKF